jgi:hypothetical protein
MAHPAATKPDCLSFENFPKKPEPELDTQTSKTYRNQSSTQQPELPELAAPNSQSRISNLKPVTNPNPLPNQKQPNPKHTQRTKPNQRQPQTTRIIHITQPDKQPE